MDPNEPGFHKIQYCSFKNFDGSGNDLGIEPIRIGVSTQAEFDSRTTVEYCYFTNCNGDGELISNKASQNVLRYNTFEENRVAELVLRHGDEAVVYGNFFLNNMGGVRVREGSNHFIYNNYFDGLSRRSIFLQNESSDPLSDIHVYFNTIVNSAEMILGGDGGSNPPTNVTIANNIFVDPDGQLFEQATGTESWIGNFSQGEIGIDRPADGLVEIDLQLMENSGGFFQPGEASPVVAGAADGYPNVPLFSGMEYDNEILLDLMQASRPATITDRAIGASEFSASLNVQPHVTEANTGPSYLFDNLVDYLTTNLDRLSYDNQQETRTVRISSNVAWTVSSSEDWVTTDLTSGSGDARVRITTSSNDEAAERTGTVTVSSSEESVTIEVNQEAGDPVVLGVFEETMVLSPNPSVGRMTIKNLPADSDFFIVEVFQLDGRKVYAEAYHTTMQDLLISTEELSSGTYILKLKSLSSEGVALDGQVQKLIIE